MDLYATKASINDRLVPLVDRLAQAGVSPDALTISAVPVAVAGGLSLLASNSRPVMLLLVPVFAALRILLNLLDGNMARRTGRIHARGELYNEVGDRLADVAFLAPAAFMPGADEWMVLAGVLGAVLASYVGVTARAAGAKRLYGGILSKPGRMALLVVCSIWAFVAGAGATTPWAVFGPILLVGTALTFVERFVAAWRALR